MNEFLSSKNILVRVETLEDILDVDSFEKLDIEADIPPSIGADIDPDSVIGGYWGELGNHLARTVWAERLDEPGYCDRVDAHIKRQTDLLIAAYDQYSPKLMTLMRKLHRLAELCSPAVGKLTGPAGPLHRPREPADAQTHAGPAFIFPNNN